MKDNCSGVRNSSYIIAKKKKFKHHIRMTSSLVSQRSWVPVPLKPEYFSGSVSQPLKVVLCNRDDLSFVIFFVNQTTAWRLSFLANMSSMSITHLKLNEIPTGKILSWLTTGILQELMATKIRWRFIYCLPSAFKENNINKVKRKRNFICICC